MTISTSASKVVALGNGVTTAFSFSFLIPQSGEEQVTFTDANGVQTVLSNTQYAVNSFGNPNGGTVTYPLVGSPIPTGTSLTIARVLPLVQGTTISNQGAFYPQVVEGALDYEMMVSQQIQQEINQTVRGPIVDQNPIGQLPAAAQRVGKYFAFDSSGNPLMVAGAGPATNLVINGSSSGQVILNAQPTASGVIVLPNGNDTLIARGSTDTITGPKTFAANSLILAGSTSGTTLLNATAIASGTITIPVGSDTLVGRASVDTFTGAKTFNSGTAIFAGATSGTTTVNASATASGTLTLPAATDTLVGRGTTDTFTGPKTFGATGNVGQLIIAGNTSGSTVLNASAVASGTLTLPSATDTLVARSTTDTLSNKTFSDQPSVRLNLTVPVYVSSLSALQALDTTKDVVACVTGSGAQTFYNWTAGNFSTQITAADPRYVASSANPTGSSGAWVSRGSVETGQFFETSGAQVHRFADRVLVGNAVTNKANPVASQADWLTTFQLASGRTTGFLEFAQMGVLNNSNSNSANAIVAGAQTSNLAGAGNCIPAIFVGVNNNSSFSTNTYGWYAEAYRMSGATGGAYGCEIDVMNYQALAATNPFAQASAQTVGMQMAAGGSLSAVGQFAASVGINFWNNNASFDKGINFGFTAINGTNGTDGNTGEAIAMATGHAITYYYGNNTKSWTLKAKIGVNGDYTFTSAGTGAVSVPKIVAGSGLLTSTASATVTNNAAALVAPNSGTVLHVGGVDATSAIVEVDSFGTSAPAQVQGRHARGTAASRTATQQSDQILNINGVGYGATGYGGGRAQIIAVASENWTDSAQGAQWSFLVTTSGGTTTFNAASILNNGMFSTVGGSIGRNAPVTKAGNFTLGAAENWLIINQAGTTTVTLPAASAWSGREVMFKTIQAQTLVSASSNVVPLAGGAAGTAILAATAGKWATLVSDGTNWVIMQGN